MAGILHALGSETSLFFRGDTVLRHGYDRCALTASALLLQTFNFCRSPRFVVDRLMDELRRHGPRLFPLSEPASLSKHADGITITLKNGATHGPFDQARAFFTAPSSLECKSQQINATRFCGRSDDVLPPTN
jgi:hypothetical protein